MPIIPKNERKRPGRKPRRIYKDYEKDYHSQFWRNFSKKYRQDHRHCAICQAEDDLVIDHSIPTRIGGAMYDIRNMAVLCRPCHSKKTGDEMKDIYMNSKKNEDGELIPVKKPYTSRGQP